MIELVDESIKRDIITIFYKFEKLEENFNVLIRSMEDITKTQIELLKLKTTKSDVKNIVEGLTANQIPKIANTEDILMKIIQNIRKIEMSIKKMKRVSVSSGTASSRLIYMYLKYHIFCLIMFPFYF